MAKSKSNDQNDQNPGPVPHHKASDDLNAELDRLKRDPNRVQKLLDREGTRKFDSQP
jgi:hypothetical protein